MRRFLCNKNLIRLSVLVVILALVVFGPQMHIGATESDNASWEGQASGTLYDYNEYAYDSYQEAIEASVYGEENEIIDNPSLVNGNSYSTYTSLETAGACYRGNMVSRNSYVELAYVNAESWSALYDYYYALGYREKGEEDYNAEKEIHKAIASAMYFELRDEAFKHTGNYIEGDYLLWNFAGANISYISIENGYFYQINISYLSTASQEQEIDKELERLFSNELSGWENVPDYEKVKMVYRWMTDTFVYEQSIDNHSTYSGMINHATVCQGFATSMYRILGTMGIETRVVTNDWHGWNIVKIGRYWYNLDATWDAGRSEDRWRYFMPDDYEFTYKEDHIRGDDYDTEEFHAAYPMASSPYNYVAERTALGVDYRTHVQTYGWQEFVFDGVMSGTSGQGKRLEGIEIKLSNTGSNDLDIEYRTHIQSYGWENDWKCNGAMSGTSNQAKRLEAIQIRLTGADADNYHVWYRVHAQTYGWLGWAKDGEKAGTAGQSKRLEGIQILVLPAGETPVGLIGYSYVDYGVKSTSTNPTEGLVNYKTHVQTYGWQGYVYDGSVSGTSGKAKRLEGINISLGDTGYSGGIRYTTHVQSYGWQGDKDKPETWSKDGAMSGTSGEAKRLEGIRIQLYGEVANHYDVYYRVHAQTYGWLDWAKNGGPSGTAGLRKRLEAIQIVLVPKGGAAPGSTARPFVENK